jgi:hypothetical protein
VVANDLLADCDHCPVYGKAGMTAIYQQPKANKSRLDNRWGCSVGHAFRNFNPPSRFDAYPRPSGASALRSTRK